MNLNAYLHFKGNCEEAFKFYERTLGGKMLMKVTYGEAPPQGQMPPDFDKNKMMHARIQVGDTLLMGSDAPPDRFQKPQGFSVNIDCKTPEDADRIYNALSAGGQIMMPIQKTFWAERFGMLVDKFGTPWMVNCETRS